MSKEKQIEELAKIIGHCESTLHPDIECHNKATGCYCIENPCHNQRIAENLYNAGYRKQSEVVREFAEEAKLEFYREFDEIIPSIMADKIDDLVKKYTEEEK